MQILVERVGERTYRCVGGHEKLRSELRGGKVVRAIDVETREAVLVYKVPDGVMILRPPGAEVAETRAIAFISRLMRNSRVSKSR